MHHTTDKGDIGVAYVTAELISRGLAVLTPVSASSPYDLVVLHEGRPIRIQVKYRTVNPLGVLTATMGRASITARKAVRRPLAPEEQSDCFAFYCPDTKECYFVDVRGQANGCVILRVKPSAHPKRLAVNFAKDFTSFPPRALQVAPHVVRRLVSRAAKAAA